MADRIMTPVAKKKNEDAVALGRLRAKKLTAQRVKEIASLGGKARAKALSKEGLAHIAREAGLIGGRVRAQKLSSKRRADIARKAAAARWAKTRKDGGDA